jgi:hypothetical protein
LESVIERSLVLAPSETLQAEDIRLDMSPRADRR